MMAGDCLDSNREEEENNREGGFKKANKNLEKGVLMEFPFLVSPWQQQQEGGKETMAVVMLSCWLHPGSSTQQQEGWGRRVAGWWWFGFWSSSECCWSCFFLHADQNGEEQPKEMVAWSLTAGVLELNREGEERGRPNCKGQFGPMGFKKERSSRALWESRRKQMKQVLVGLHPPAGSTSSPPRKKKQQQQEGGAAAQVMCWLFVQLQRAGGRERQQVLVLAPFLVVHSKKEEQRDGKWW